MNFIVVGTNHKFSPIEIREKLSFSKTAAAPCLLALADLDGVNGVVLLSTCNRVEIYLDVLDAKEGFEKLERFLYEYLEIFGLDLSGYLYRYIDKDAIKHLFSVAGGLDSQILGETQILGQIKDAYRIAKELFVTTNLIDEVFKKAIYVGGLVRNKTGISSGNLSVGSLVLSLIKRHFTTLENRKILIVGVGKISELVTRYLKKENANCVFVSNRTYAKAVDFARALNAQALRFDKLKQQLFDTDIIISATRSPHPILKKKDFESINRPLLIVDLAVPRDVEESVKDIKGITLFNLDDLSCVAQENLDKRKEAVFKANLIIENEVKTLWQERNSIESGYGQAV